MKSALASILVILGACDRASADAPRPSSPPVASAEIVVPVAASSSVIEPTAPQASASSSSVSSPGPAREQPVVKQAAAPARQAPKTVYVCPMHPEVTSDAPGLCPKCNMKLEQKPQSREIRAVPAPSGEPL
ncbi:hypothetical protein AKJ09_01620 [Labilithrix luteola]|uniref:Heavy metal binding domain-containing protein n=1 Tax=Labilithrix luteola TaxID=1391654 RepID=A0A0K1PNI5_9BACT|nr:heavy metal-binding domain-containing protein [Labilithrix luteola]AKU94956.1 hypothetical protein AKJ09_01620 [Labilithrix luteola]